MFEIKENVIISKKKTICYSIRKTRFLICELYVYILIIYEIPV